MFSGSPGWSDSVTCWAYPWTGYHRRTGCLVQERGEQPLPRGCGFGPREPGWDPETGCVPEFHRLFFCFIDLFC